MKRILTFLIAGAATAALGTACNNAELRDGNGTGRSPLNDNVFFLNTTPGEETILFAKAGIPYEESTAVLKQLRSEYGESNVYPGGSIPIEEAVFLGYQDYNIVVDPEAVPDCYEITMTIEFEESSVPSVDYLIGFGIPGVRINGRTATCKRYGWAFTEDGASMLISRTEESVTRFLFSSLTQIEGKIIGTSTIKKLGPEVRDVPITF